MASLKRPHITINQQALRSAADLANSAKRFNQQLNYKTIDGIVEVVNANQTYDVRIPGRAHVWPDRHCILDIQLNVGDGCTLGFLENNPQLAMIIAAKFVGPHATPNPTLLTLGLWMQSEASPLCNRRPRDNFAPFPWEATTSSEISYLDRHYPADYGSGSGMIGWYSAEGVVLLDGAVAALTTSFEPDDSAVKACLVREYDLATMAEKSWAIVLDTTFLPTTGQAQRRNGFLFYNPDNQGYTVAARSGLAHIRRTVTDPLLTPWRATYGSLPPESSCSVVTHTNARTFALQGAWLPYDSATDSAANSAIHAYSCLDLVKRFSAFKHVAKIILPTQLPGCTVVRGCGDWTPYESGTPIVENTRWPYMASLSAFLVWVFGQGEADSNGNAMSSQGKLLAVSPKSGSVRVLDDMTAPVDMIAYRDDLISAAEPAAIHNSTAHPDEWIALGGGLFDGGTRVDSFWQMYAQWFAPDDMSYVWGPDGTGPMYAPGQPLGYQPWTSDIYDYRGTTTEGLLSSGHSAPALACGSSDWGHFPRGIVHQTETSSSYYVILRQPVTISAQEAGRFLVRNPPPWSDYEFRYAGNFTDTPHPYRVYHLEVGMRLGLSYKDGSIQRLFRPQVRHYSSKGALLGTADLGRLFTVDSTRYLREPDIWEYAVSGAFLWILATDWTDKDTQQFSLIVLNRDTLAQVDVVNLESTDRTLDLTKGRPQLIVGEDETSAYAEIFSAWNFTGVPKWMRQLVRKTESTTIVEGAATDNADLAPVAMTETANLAVAPGAAYWLQDGKSLRQILQP